MSLKELEDRIRREQTFTEYPNRPWLVPRTHAGVEVLDVVIVGGGQSGLAAAYGLMRERITRLVVLDASPRGSEGPWRTFARMRTLRTPKMGSGLDLGNPALTPQAWYEAQYGQRAWSELGKIPKAVWHDYLDWYRKVLAIPVRNGVRVTRIKPTDQNHQILEVHTDAQEVLLARRVVLATGLNGSGRWYVPDVASHLTSEYFGHTEADIDFDQLRNKRVGVLGGGASAFDNAATALEAGAARVDLCVRIPRFPSVNPYKWLEFSGFLSAYHSLPDDKRWRFMRQVSKMNQPPPQETMWRCTQHANFHMHANAQWLHIAQTAGGLVVHTPVKTLEFDFLIFATGISNDLAKRPELADAAPHIALWSDCYAPPEGERDEGMARAPYLGKGFEFKPKTPGHGDWVSRLHNFNYGATLSMGLSAASITGMKYGIRKLIDGVVQGLFLEDEQVLFEQLVGYDEPEIVHIYPPAAVTAA